jgi:hypothetical protein
VGNKIGDCVRVFLSNGEALEKVEDQRGLWTVQPFYIILPLSRVLGLKDWETRWPPIGRHPDPIETFVKRSAPYEVEPQLRNYIVRPNYRNAAFVHKRLMPHENTGILDQRAFNILLPPLARCWLSNQ